MKSSHLLSLARALCISTLSVAACAAAQPAVRTAAHATPREMFAAERVRSAVTNLPDHVTILLAQRRDPLLASFDKQIPDLWPNAQEAFLLKRIGNTIIVAGYDASGVLYGAEELCDRIRAAHALPAELDFEDHPQLKIRGAVIGLQRPELTYDDAEYDYPYTPQQFPWFYDKAAWLRYLDTLAEQRMNALFLWNGHPFTSLLRLPRYPEAQELPTAQLEQNIAMFHWLTTEADKRGIWVLQGFYNIHLSHAFARAHQLPYHLSAPTPLASEYTRYCLSEFIRHYPNVGIFTTLGEAMGPHYGPEWMTSTIIPGVLDGLEKEEKAVGHSVPQPPIIVRAHATDIDQVMAASRPLYANIDTMWKWTGESYTWTNIRGSVRERFQRMVQSSNTTIVNMHLMSNFEPFRWGDPEFVCETVRNFVRIGIGGVHVYPLRYWEWPYTADNTTPRLLQTDRDWIWFAAWSRYAWNPERDPQRESDYWTYEFAERFAKPGMLNALGHSDRIAGAESLDTFRLEDHGLSDAERMTGHHLLTAYELAGQCAPEVIRRIGITEGNRQVLSLGMTMPQLIDAARFNPAQTLWTADAPDGEELSEWVANEEHHVPHHGENPFSVTEDATQKADAAVTEARAAADGVAADARPEYERIVTDLEANAALMHFYRDKVQAAALVMQYAYHPEISLLQKARTALAASVADFATLTSITDHTYRNAAGMETSQRQIPVRGGPTTNHWRDLLPVYQRELATFDKRIAALQVGAAPATTNAKPAPLPQVPFQLVSGGGETFSVHTGASLYTDQNAPITSLAPELDGLTGIRLSLHQETPIRFTLSAPAQILVGFFKSNSRKVTNVAPDAEQWNILLPDAVSEPRGLPISVWAKTLPAGENDLDLGKGAYVVLGFIPADTHVTPHIPVDPQAKTPPNLDWMFEN